jgi:hypothetical protein
LSQKPLSYTECVHRVLQAISAPITMDELIEAVGEMRPLTAKNIRSTLHNAINQSPLCTSLGDGRYWWMPHLLKENRFRLHLSTEDVEQGQLAITDEARLGLWPSLFGSQSRTRDPLVHVELADGPLLQEPVELLDIGIWGFKPCPELAQWYKAQHVRPGDDLILTVIDADAAPRRYRLKHQPAHQRDETCIKARKQQMADAAYKLIRKGQAEPAYSLAPKLAARGLYRDPSPPDPLDEVLSGDSRFRDAGLRGYARADDSTYIPSPFEMMGDPSATIQNLMDMVLGEYETDFLAPPTDREIENIIRRLLTEPLTEDEAEEEIERLSMAEESAVPRLMHFVASRDPEQHQLACQILAALESDLAIEPLRRKLHDPKVIDDYKLDIITALMHLDGLRPDEDPFEYLRDATGAVLRSQQEFLAQLQDPLTLNNFLEGDFEALPIFQSPEAMQHYVENGGPATFSLLLCLLHSAQDQVVRTAIKGLETLGLPEAVSYLEERAAHDPSRKVRRAAKEAVQRLTAQVGRRGEWLAPPDEPLQSCFISSLDGSGGQVLLIARQTAEGHCKLLNVMFNDHEGIKDSYGGLSPTLQKVEEMIDGGLSAMGIELVEISLDKARDELDRALHTTQQARRRLPIGFMAWRHWALGEDPDPPEVFPLPEVSDTDRDALLADCDELLDLEEFNSWFFNVSDLQGLDRQFRRLQDQDPADEEKQEALISQAVRRIVDKAHRQLLCDRLRRQAWLLAQIYQDDDIPRMALVAADALEDDAFPLEEHPLLRGMIQASFLNAIGEPLWHDREVENGDTSDPQAGRHRKTRRHEFHPRPDTFHQIRRRHPRGHGQRRAGRKIRSGLLRSLRALPGARQRHRRRPGGVGSKERPGPLRRA